MVKPRDVHIFFGVTCDRVRSLSMTQLHHVGCWQPRPAGINPIPTEHRLCSIASRPDGFLMFIADIYPAKLQCLLWSKERIAEQHRFQINNNEFLVHVFSCVCVWVRGHDVIFSPDCLEDNSDVNMPEYNHIHTHRYSNITIIQSG